MPYSITLLGRTVGGITLSYVRESSFDIFEFESLSRLVDNDSRGLAKLARHAVARVEFMIGG